MFLSLCSLHVLSLRSLQAAGQQETEIKMKPKMILITKMQRRSSSTQRRAVTRERERAEQPTTKTEIFKLLKDNISICFQYVLLRLTNTHRHTQTQTLPHLTNKHCNCLVLFNPHIKRKEQQQQHDK